MEAKNQEEQEKRERKGLIGSFIYTVLLLIVLLFPLLSYQIPAPGQEGIRISFGQPNQGDGTAVPLGEPIPETSAEPSEPTPEPTEAESPPQETAQAEPAQPTEPIAEATPPPAAEKQPDTPIKQKVVTADNSKEIAAAKEKRKQEEEKKIRDTKTAKEKAKKAKENTEKAKQVAAKQAEEAEAAKKLAAEEAKRKAAEAKALAEAKKKADEEKKYQETKDKFGSMFGQTGSQGTSGKPGDAGVANGDPDAKILEGTKSYGQGSKDIGGGLSGRGVVKRPSLKDNSQKEGKVKVEICVNKSGKVIKAEYSQFGSTTIDTDLIALAETSAKQYIFTPSANPEQCGEVLITFSLQ